MRTFKNKTAIGACRWKICSAEMFGDFTHLVSVLQCVNVYVLKRLSSTRIKNLNVDIMRAAREEQYGNCVDDLLAQWTNHAKN